MFRSRFFVTAVAVTGLLIGSVSRVSGKTVVEAIDDRLDYAERHRDLPYIASLNLDANGINSL